MSATVYAPVVKRNYSGGGEEWSEEKKQEYADQWTQFAALMAKRKQGQSRDFDAEVLEVGPRHDVPNTFPGAKSAIRSVRTLRFQLAQEGVDMLRFQKDSADNPFNDKTLLHQLIVAALGITPVEEEGLSINFADLVGKRVRLTIEKQKERIDGKRGGFYTDIKGIEPIFEDEVPAPAPKRAPSASTSRGATSPAKAISVEEELPF